MKTPPQKILKHNKKTPNQSQTQKKPNQTKQTESNKNANKINIKKIPNKPTKNPKAFIKPS